MSDSSSNRFMFWLTAIILPMVAIFLSVYEIFFKDSETIPGMQPPPATSASQAPRPQINVQQLQRDLKLQLQRLAKRGAVKKLRKRRTDVLKIMPQELTWYENLLKTAEESSARLQKKFAKIHKKAKRYILDWEYERAIRLYQQFLSANEEDKLPAFIKQKIAASYYQCAFSLYNQMKTLGQLSAFVENIREKLQKCVELAPQGSYAGKAQKLLKHLEDV